MATEIVAIDVDDDDVEAQGVRSASEEEWDPNAAPDDEAEGEEEGSSDEEDEEAGDEDDSGDSDVLEDSEDGAEEAEDDAGDFVVVGDGEERPRARKKRRKGKDPSARGKRARDRRKKKKLAEFIEDDDLDDTTKKAREAERERAMRMNLGNDDDATPEDRVCLNMTNGAVPTGDEGTVEAPIFVHPEINKRLKQHQIRGARFMWSHIAAEPNGFGCVLADFMGLGKTLQVITVVQAFLTMKTVDKEGYLAPRHKHVLILAPTICVRNWEAEVVKWIGKKDARKIGLQTLESSREKKMTDRVHVVKQWHRRGGILIMGYELYRILALQSSGDEKIAAGNAKHTHLIKQVYPLLCKPGPDMIVLDEGHRVRDHKSKLVKALSHVQTARRIILTGYPLQNHLEEYWTMVNFARPDYLGSLEEFKNRFVDPIENAQCVDSCEADLRLARQRAYILTNELRTLVLRRDQQYLFKQLPPKKEWVIVCKLADQQAKLYRQFLEQGVPKRLAEIPGEGVKYVVDVLGGFHVALAIANHPDVLVEMYKRLEEEYKNGSPKKAGKKRKRLVYNMDDDVEDDFDIFAQPILDAAPAANRPKTSTGSDDSDMEILNALEGKAPANPKTPAPGTHRLSFAKQFMETYITKELEASGKMMILMQILEASQEIGDRVIIFSQSIPTLNTIGELITRYNRRQRTHSKRLNYLRIDGSTPQQERFRQIGQFNDPEEDVDLIMISTKAGGEGINLCAGNRIIIFDVCWNPCNDSQSMCRSYRFGQTKPVFVYRFVTAGTMEKKVYDLQIRKEGVAKRIVDEKATQRQFKNGELQDYFNVDEFEASLKYNQGKDEASKPHPPPKEDAVLMRILSDFGAENGGVTENAEVSSERCIIDWFEQETMFEEDLDQQCTEQEQEEITEYYNYVKALRRMRKNGEHLISREGLLLVSCEACHVPNEIYPTATTMVPVPRSIECKYCRKPTRTDGAREAPPPGTNVAGVPNAHYAQMLAIAAARFGSQVPVALPNGGYAIPPPIPGSMAARAATAIVAGGAPDTSRQMPSHLTQLMEQQQAKQQEMDSERAHLASEAMRLALERQQIQLQQRRKTDERRRVEREKMELKERHLLVLRRGMEGCQKLKRSAEECGATIAIEVNSQLTDIVSAMSLEDTLKWLKLSKLPRDVDLRDAVWLRNEVAKAKGLSTPAASRSPATSGRASVSPAGSESIATDRSHDDSDPPPRAVASIDGMIELLDSDDEGDKPMAPAHQPQALPASASDSDDDFEILD